MHKKKMIVPIVISILVILYYIFYFGIIIALIPGKWKYVLGGIPILLIFGIIKVCIERIKEIKEGEEDDLSKY